jgi:hypothetical protein
MSKSDPQQKRAYSWEAGFTTWAPVGGNESQLRYIIDQACQLYKVPTPEIKFVTKNARAGKRLTSEYNPNNHVIKLRPRHHEVGTALHEAAHAITDYIMGPWTEPHGKEWLGIFIHLLNKFKIAPRSGLEAHARAKGLKFASASKSAPRSVRAAFKAKSRHAREWRASIKDLLK